MAQLTKIQMIRFSENQVNLLNELKRFNIKPHAFIRIALQEKLERDLPVLIKEEQRKLRDFCPF